MVRKAWDYHKSKVKSSALMGGVKNAKTKLKKMGLLNEEVEEKLIKTYFERQKLLFEVKYLSLNGQSFGEEDFSH